jgi:hypothetical protein
MHAVCGQPLRSETRLSARITGRSIGVVEWHTGMENPRGHYAASLRARPAPVVRGSSRRIMIVRCRPANIRVINRRDRRLDYHRCCVPRSANDEDKTNALIHHALESPTK